MRLFQYKDSIEKLNNTKDSMKIISRVELNKIIKRFYPGDKKVGHVYSILENARGKNMPLTAMEKDSTTFSAILKTPKEMPFTEMQFTSFENATKNAVQSKNILQKLMLSKFVEPSHIRQNKETLYTHLEQKRTVPFSEARHQEDYLKFLNTLYKTNPEYFFNRQGQVIIEILNGRVSFDNKLLETYCQYFKLIDIIGRNDGKSDGSTMFNMFAGNHLVENVKEFSNIECRVVVATCKNSADLSNISMKAAEFLRRSKNFTGNTMADVTLNDVPFDFKADPSPDKNFIVFCNYESFTTSNDVLRYHNALKSHLDKIVRNTNSTLFQQQTYKLMLDLEKATSLTIFEKQAFINALVLKNINKMADNDKISIIVPISQKAFSPNPLLEEKVKSIEVSQKRAVIDSSVTKKSIIAQVATWNPNQQKSFHYGTYDIFGNKEEVD